MANNINFQSIKDWVTFVVAVVACVAATIFWIQTSHDSEIARIDTKVEKIQEQIDKIRDGNNEILRIIGRLEGKIDG